MARIRTIKPGFFKHGDLYDAEQESGLPLRVAYAGLWTVADREGRFKWKPRDIKVDVLPYDNLSMDDVLNALEAGGFVQSYIIDGQKYGWIPAFLQHQHVNKNESQSSIPAPVKNNNARAKRVTKPSSHHEERKGKEGKGKEGDAREARESSFEEFWGVCPKKAGKGAAEKAFAKASKTVDPAVLIAGMRKFAALQIGKDPDFIAHPSTWLNQKRWLDEPPKPNGTGPPAPIPANLAEVQRLEEEHRLRNQDSPNVH